MPRGCGCISALGCAGVGVVAGGILVWIYYADIKSWFSSQDYLPEAVNISPVKQSAGQVINSLPDTVVLKEPGEIRLPEVPASAATDGGNSR